MKRFLHLEEMEQLIKRYSNLRVSEEAKKELKFVLEEEAKKIAVRAAELAKYAGRRTILAEDVKLAVR